MRITQATIYRNLVKNMTKKMEDVSNVQKQISSGTKLGKLSDSPDDLGIAMNVQTTLNKQEQYKKNIDDQLAWLSQSESALTDAAETMIRAKEFAINAGNAGVGSMEMKSMSTELDELLDQTMLNANTLLGRSHVFAGYQMDKAVIVANQTSVPTKLFPPDQAGIDVNQDQVFMWQFNDPNASTQTNVNAGDTQSAFKIELLNADGTTFQDTGWQSGAANKYTFPAGNFQQGSTYQWRVTTKDQAGTEAVSSLQKFTGGISNIPPDNTNVYTTPIKQANAELVGDKWYYSNTDDIVGEISPGMTIKINVSADEMFNAVKTLTALKKALDAGDSKAAMNLVGDIDTSHNSLVQQRATVGSKVKRLEDLKSQMEYQEVDLKDYFGQASGVVIEEATLDLANLQLAYQASLSVSAKLLQTNILDYLK